MLAHRMKWRGIFILWVLYFGNCQEAQWEWIQSRGLFSDIPYYEPADINGLEDSRDITEESSLLGTVGRLDDEVFFTVNRFTSPGDGRILECRNAEVTLGFANEAGGEINRNLVVELRLVGESEPIRVWEPEGLSEYTIPLKQSIIEYNTGSLVYMLIVYFDDMDYSDSVQDNYLSVTISERVQCRDIKAGL